MLMIELYREDDGFDGRDPNDDERYERWESLHEGWESFRPLELALPWRA